MFAGIWPIVLGFCMRVDESRATSSEQTYQASSFSDVDASRHNETRPPEVCDSFWPEFPFCHAPLIGQQQKSLTWPKVVRRTQATSFKEIETCSRGACSKTKSYEVWGLEKTFAFIKNGSSISRFGDGELRLMEGAKHINHGMEIGGKQLRMKLNVVAKLGGCNHDKFCIGLVDMFKQYDKQSVNSHNNWFVHPQHRRRYQGLVTRFFPKGVYCSASITRLDHWPELTKDQLEGHWREVFANKTILIVSGRNMSGHEPVFKLSKAVYVAPPPPKRLAFRIYGSLKSSTLLNIAKLQPDITLLSIGPTATILAAELACNGVQVLDVGSVSNL